MNGSGYNNAIIVITEHVTNALLRSERLLATPIIGDLSVSAGAKKYNRVRNNSPHPITRRLLKGRYWLRIGDPTNKMTLTMLHTVLELACKPYEYLLTAAYARCSMSVSRNKFKIIATP